MTLLAVVPGWVLLHGLSIPIGTSSIKIKPLETGFMPEMDEGAFVLDYNMPVGTSLAQTDKVLRRVEQVLLDTPDIQSYIRRTGAELGFFATESYTGDILVSLKPSGERRRWKRSLTPSATSSRNRCRSSKPSSCRSFSTRSATCAGVDQPIEVKVFGPEPAVLRELATKVGEILEKVEGIVDVNTHVLLGNPDIVVRPDSIQTARVGLTELDVESQLNAALYGQVASTVPEQDRMTKIRVRYPDRVRYDRESLGRLPISLATATPTATPPREPDRRRPRLPESASSRSSSLPRFEWSAPPTNSGAKISSPSSR